MKKLSEKFVELNLRDIDKIIKIQKNWMGYILRKNLKKNE